MYSVLARHVLKSGIAWLLSVPLFVAAFHAWVGVAFLENEAPLRIVTENWPLAGTIAAHVFAIVVLTSLFMILLVGVTKMLGEKPAVRFTSGLSFIAFGFVLGPMALSTYGSNVGFTFLSLACVAYGFSFFDTQLSKQEEK